MCWPGQCLEHLSSATSFGPSSQAANILHLSTSSEPHCQLQASAGWPAGSIIDHATNHGVPSNSRGKQETLELVLDLPRASSEAGLGEVGRLCPGWQRFQNSTGLQCRFTAAHRHLEDGKSHHPTKCSGILLAFKYVVFFVLK